MSLRDELLPCVDEIRGIADELGVRVRPVEHVVRGWSGAEPGLGELAEVVTTLTPTPRVARISRENFGPGGAFEQGDLIVTQVSASYTLAHLKGDALAEGERLIYRVDGKPYRLVGLEPRAFEFRLHLRRQRR